MDKIQRATEIHRGMTPHQMALRIVELEDGVAEIVGQAVTEHNKRINELLSECNATGVAIDSAARGILPEQHPMLSRLQMIANMSKRITELQDALELAEEAVRAKQHSSVAVPECLPLVTDSCSALMTLEEAIAHANEKAIGNSQCAAQHAQLAKWLTDYRAMLAAAPKLGGELWSHTVAADCISGTATDRLPKTTTTKDQAMNNASLGRTKYVRTTPRTAAQPKTYEPGTYMFYATIAARNEAEVKLEEAQMMWLRAKPVANKEVNREWAGRRAEVCKQRMNKWPPA